MAVKNPRKLFVNIVVRDLKASMDFFRKLGFEFNPKFTDENAACMIVSDEAFFMLLTPPAFRAVLEAQAERPAGADRSALLDLVRQPRRGRRARQDGARGRRRARHGSPGPRFHVPVELLRPRRPSLGGDLDGSEGR